MSVSPNFNYLAVSSVMSQSILIFNIISNTLFVNLVTNDYNTVAHEWFTNDKLCYMPPNSGDIYIYTLSTNAYDQQTLNLNGSYNVFSVHRHKINSTLD
jgi:hypothetical protein